jgi:flagellar biosynthesis/type III secretory pathway protein FliH
MGGSDGRGLTKARILKQAQPGRSRVSPFDIRGIDEFAPKVIPTLLPEEEPAFDAEAEEEAIDPETLRAQVLAEARAEAERKVHEAYQEGLRRGMEAGQEAFEASLAQCVQALHEAAEAIAAHRLSFIDSVEPQVISLTRQLTERIARHAWAQNPERIQESVREALGQLADAQQLTVRLHPDDMAALREHQVQLLEEFPGVASLSLLADDTITPGGCVIASAQMQADARLETILARVLEALDG